MEGQMVAEPKTEEKRVDLMTLTGEKAYLISEKWHELYEGREAELAAAGLGGNTGGHNGLVLVMRNLEDLVFVSNDTVEDIPLPKRTYIEAKEPFLEITKGPKKYDLDIRATRGNIIGVEVDRLRRNEAEFKATYECAELTIHGTGKDRATLRVFYNP